MKKSKSISQDHPSGKKMNDDFAKEFVKVIGSFWIGIMILMRQTVLNGNSDDADDDHDETNNNETINGIMN